MELRGQRRKLAFAGNGTPRGLVDRIVVRRALKMHSADTAIGENRKANVRLARLRQRRLSLLRQQGNPVAVDIGFESAQVLAEVDALHIGEDLDTTQVVGLGRAAGKAPSTTRADRPTF